MNSIYYSSCPVPNAFLIAVKRFGEHLAGVGVKFELLPASLSAAHFSFDLPRYSRFGGEIPPLLAEGVRTPGATRLIGLTPCRTRQGFLVRPDDAITNVAALAGRRIGITPNGRAMLQAAGSGALAGDSWETTQRALGTWEARALLNTLARGGVRLEQVELVEVPNPWAAHRREAAEGAVSFAPKDLFPDATGPDGNRQIRALLEWRVDAVFSFLPYVAQTELRGFGRLIEDLGADGANDYVSAWTVSSALAVQQPELVQAAVDVVVTAGYWAQEHPDEVAALHAENFGVSEEAVWMALGRDFHRQLVPRLDSECMSILDRTQSFLVSRGVIPAPITLSNWAEPRFLTNATRLDG